MPIRDNSSSSRAPGLDARILWNAFLYLKQICALCLANKGEFVMVSFRLTLRCTTTYDSSMSRLLLGVPLV